MGRLVRPRPLSGAPDLNSPRPLPRRHAQLQVPSCPAWRLPHCPCSMGVGTSLSAAGLWGASRSHEDPGPWGPSVHPAVMAEHLPHLPGHRPVSERQSCSLSPDSWPRAGPGPTVPCRLPLPKPGAPAAPDPLSLGFSADRWVVAGGRAWATSTGHRPWQDTRLALHPDHVPSAARAPPGTWWGARGRAEVRNASGVSRSTAGRHHASSCFGDTCPLPTSQRGLRGLGGRKAQSRCFSRQAWAWPGRGLFLPRPSSPWAIGHWARRGAPTPPGPGIA